MPELKFNSKIYREKAVREAISVYSHLAKFTIKNNKGYIKVKMDKIDQSFENIIVDEFANYVLGMTKKCL